MTRVPYAGDEHALDGGNVAAGVVRVGDTVRKPAGFWTPAVEALLWHLWRVGFTGAPRDRVSFSPQAGENDTR